MDGVYENGKQLVGGYLKKIGKVSERTKMTVKLRSLIKISVLQSLFLLVLKESEESLKSLSSSDLICKPKYNCQEYLFQTLHTLLQYM